MTTDVEAARIMARRDERSGLTDASPILTPEGAEAYRLERQRCRDASTLADMVLACWATGTTPAEHLASIEEAQDRILVSSAWLDRARELITQHAELIEHHVLHLQDTVADAIRSAHTGV